MSPSPDSIFDSGKKMVTGDDLLHLVLKGEREGQKEFVRGLYGRVYEVSCEVAPPVGIAC